MGGDARVNDESSPVDTPHREPALRRIGAAVDAIADALFLVDVEHMTLVDINLAACELLGRSRQALLDMAPEWVFDTPRPALEAAWRVLIEGEHRQDTLETIYRRADGRQVNAEVRRRAVQVDGAWLIVKTVRDITASSAIKLALQRQAEQHALLARFGQQALEERTRRCTN